MDYRLRLKIAPFLFLLPFFAVFIFFMIYPIGFSVVLSFGKYKSQAVSFVGLKNYAFVLQDSLFLQSLKNTFIILIIQVPTMIFLGMILAVCMNSKYLRLRGMFRTGIFMPVLIDAVSYTLIFSMLFSENGVINSLLGSQIEWFTNGAYARAMLILAVNWKWVGYNSIILLAGLQNIPLELYEAAEIDGAGVVQRFFHITIPQLKPILLFVMVNSVNGTMQLFTEPNLLTHGGPTNQTLTIVQYLYNIGFKNFNFGVACAGAYLLTIVIAVITFIQLKVTKEN